MNKNTRVLITINLFCLAMLSVSHGQKVAGNSPKTTDQSETKTRNEGATMTNDQAIADATENFYAALNILFTGDAQPMKDVWAHDEDISYMGPEGDYLIGWEKIEKLWDDVAAMKLGGRVAPQKLNMVVGTDMAVITCVESGENEVDGTVERVGIRSSTVFQKRDGVWKVVGHQTDLLKFL